MKISLVKKTGYLFLGVFLLLIAYQIYSFTKDDEFVYPNIIQIFKQFFILLSKIKTYSLIFKTVLKLVLIIFVSLILSIVLGLLYYRFKDIAYLLNPIITIFKAAPFAIIAIYMFLAIGKDIAPYLMCFFVIFPIILEGVMASIDNISEGIKDDLKTLNISIFKKYFYGCIPITLPYIIMSILQSFGLGIKTMIMAEYLCNVDDSIGQIVYNIKYTMDFDILLAWLVIIVCIVSLIDLSIRKISKKLLIS